MRITQVLSPITTTTVALSGQKFGELHVVNDQLFYHCVDPTKNKSFGAVESFPAKSDAYQNQISGEATTTTEGFPKIPKTLTHTPASVNIRSAVHEYGGGSYLPFQMKNGSQVVIFTDFANKHALSASIRGQEGGDVIVPIYPPAAAKEEDIKPLRFADFEYDSHRNRIICIMEDHTNPKPDDVVNSIVSISLSCLLKESSTKEKGEENLIEVLAQGNDFYATPRLDSTGTKLAYITWNHPSMPWFVTELCVQELAMDSDNSNKVSCVGPPKVVHGCKGKGVNDGGFAVAEPRWSHDSSSKLYFLSDKSGWFNLYMWNGSEDDPIALLEKEADFSPAGQGWILAMSPYLVLADGRVMAIYTNEDGAVIVIIHPNGTLKEYSREHVPPPSIASFCDGMDGSIYFLGGSPTDPPAIWKWVLPKDDDDETVSIAEKILPSIDPIKSNLVALKPFITKPQSVKFPNKRGGLSYGYFYAPNNLSADLPNDFKPPLLIKAHGGPTAQTSTTFRLPIQYWTSRGFAILDVDYGGSTGHGREYRLALNGQWGVIDVDDVCSGAEWCISQGLVNSEALCIDGGSAGGYTTLAAIAFRDIFKCGASLYGVADISALAAETHKFESRYCDILIGKYPEEKHIYDERAPINHIDKMNCPVILLQGTEDKIVPPNQAEMMYSALTAKNIPTTMVLYDGEQHGFRMSYTVRHALNSQYSFFCKIFGIEPQKEEDLEDIEIGERIEIKQ